MAEIDYFCFPISPFSYLAGLRLEEIAARHGAIINYKPVELMRILSATGAPQPNERHESRKRYRLQEIARIAEALGMPVNVQPRHFPVNAVPASTAIISAQKDGSGDVGELLHSLLRAVWVEERDISDDEVIRECLQNAGFPPDIADKGMLTAVDVLQRNTDEALQRQVFGVPTYVVGEEVFWGQDRLDLLDRHLSMVA